MEVPIIIEIWKVWLEVRMICWESRKRKYEWRNEWKEITHVVFGTECANVYYVWIFIMIQFVHGNGTNWKPYYLANGTTKRTAFECQFQYW
jgi:hypothetical protein